MLSDGRIDPSASPSFAILFVDPLPRPHQKISHIGIFCFPRPCCSTRITISNFRSFRQQPEIHPFSPATNAVVGRNGSGKSNLFDAVQFCLLLSPRFHTLRTVSFCVVRCAVLCSCIRYVLCPPKGQRRSYSRSTFNVVCFDGPASVSLGGGCIRSEHV